MKTSLDCLPCLLRQTLQTVRFCACQEEQQQEAVQRVAAYISGCDLELTPPALASDVYKIIESITGVVDPYAEKKKESNEAALQLLPPLEEQVAALSDREGLELAVRYVIAGNIIDYGAFHSFDINGMLEKCRNSPLVVDHTEQFISTLETLSPRAQVLYLADNCGEIVFDALLVRKLYEKGLKITVAVKDGPIINDALVSDAYSAGLDKYADIISNGTRCPGTVLDLVSSEFYNLFTKADLIISKGQGNFESLSDAEREIFFLLTIKCRAAADQICEQTGCDRTTVTGTGEMAVYCSSPKR